MRNLFHLIIIYIIININPISSYFVKIEYRTINKFSIVPGVTLKDNIDFEVGLGSFIGNFIFFENNEGERSHGMGSESYNDTSYMLWKRYDYQLKEYGALISPAINYYLGNFYLIFGWHLALIYRNDKGTLEEEFVGKTESDGNFTTFIIGKKDYDKDYWHFFKFINLGVGYKWKRLYMSAFSDGSLINSGFKIGYFIKK